MTKHTIARARIETSMQRRGFILASILLSTLVPAASAMAQGRSVLTSKTSASVPGSSPLRADTDAALTVATAYLDALDEGRYGEAYAMQADSLNASAPEPAFEATASALNAQTGPLLGRRMAAISWTSHPEGSPDPGIFVAIDMVERFSNVDRACSYLVLVKTNAGMKVLRRQFGFMSNATAQAIAASHSVAAVNQAWHAIARQYPHCPS